FRLPISPGQSSAAANLDEFESKRTVSVCNPKPRSTPSTHMTLSSRGPSPVRRDQDFVDRLSASLRSVENPLPPLYQPNHPTPRAPRRALRGGGGGSGVPAARFALWGGGAPARA